MLAPKRFTLLMNPVLCIGTLPPIWLAVDALTYPTKSNLHVHTAEYIKLHKTTQASHSNMHTSTLQLPPSHSWGLPHSPLAFSQKSPSHVGK